MIPKRRTFTTDIVERYKLLAGQREFTTVCNGCFLHALSLAPLRKGGFRLQCLACAMNGFILRADLVFPIVGCGQGLARMSYRELARQRMTIGQAGRALTRPDAWVPAQLGKGEADVRLSLPWGVACPACGGERAALRRDSRGKIYLSCRPGCGARIFFPDENAARRLAGWTTFRHQATGDLWLDWYREGRQAWMNWHAPIGGEHVGEAMAATAGVAREKEG